MGWIGEIGKIWEDWRWSDFFRKLLCKMYRDIEYNKLIIGDYEYERCTGASAAAWDHWKNGKYAPLG